MVCKWIFALVSVPAVLMFCVAANAQMVVDCTGNDLTAFPSISSALAVAGPNSTILIEAGPCTEPVLVQLQHSGLYLGSYWGQSTNVDGGITIQGTQSVYIYGLNLSNSAGDGIAVSDSRNITLDSCTSSGNSGNGLQVNGSSDVYVSSTGAFDHNAGGGIRINDNSFVTLAAWGGPIDISYNTGYGLYAARATFTGLGNTTISNTNAGWGVDLRGGATGNFGSVFGPTVIQNNPMGGVSLQEVAEISFWNFGGSSNIIQSNGPFGVKAGLGSQVTFYDGNQITDHSGPGVDVYANSQAYFWGRNQVLRNGATADPASAGIRIDGNSELFMRNGEVSQNNGPGVLALVNSSLDFTGVTFNGNTGGIVTCDSTATMISDLSRPDLTPPAGVRCKVPHALGNRRVIDFRPSVPDIRRLKAMQAKYKQMATKR